MSATFFLDRNSVCCDVVRVCGRAFFDLYVRLLGGVV